MQLHTISVVITANYHNPSILNNDFLVNNRIVPSDWEVDEAVSTPAVSVVRYKNGINWLVDQQRLDISKEYSIQFENHDDGEIHGLAASYVRMLKHVPYQSIGLNCVVSVANEDPLQWMTKKFLSAKSYSEDVVMVPRFLIKTDGALLNLGFGESSPQFNSTHAKSVIIQCNYHFDGPFESVEDMTKILSGWRDAKSIITSRLSEALK